MATSRSLNKAQIIGNLSRDPLIRTTTTGATVCTFGIATNTAWKDDSGQLQERTEFHNVVAWNKLAEICAQILAVGMLVYIEGELRTRTWDDENGVRHYRSEVRTSDMKLLDNKGKSGVGLEEAKSAAISSASKREQTKEKIVKKEVPEKTEEKDADKTARQSKPTQQAGDATKSEKVEDVNPADLPF